MHSLEIKDLHVSIGDKEIVKGLSLTIKTGEVHAIMGPNGTGKSTLSKAIAGHPDYTITSGDVLIDGESVLEMEPDERAPTRYCPNLHEHAHFHDDTTGQVHDIDLPADTLKHLRKLLPAGFDASSVELTFRGRAANNPHGTN